METTEATLSLIVDLLIFIASFCWLGLGFIIYNTLVVPIENRQNTIFSKIFNRLFWISIWPIVPILFILLGNPEE